jgi:diguanylate cyclase (GGDEF)-like protein/PAS domain S-box-containing protein
MNDEPKTQKQLMNELGELRQRVAELETSEKERKRTEEALEQYMAQLEALREVWLELTAQLDLDALLLSIVSRAVELLGGISGGIDLYRPERDVLEWAAGIGPNVSPIGTAIHRGEGVSGRIWETGEPLIVDDYQHWEGRAPSWEGIPITAIVGVPVRWGGEFLGSLIVHADPPRTFSPADAELLSLFANQTAIAIRNARLYEKAHRRADRLTVVNHIARAVGATLDLDDLMETVSREVAAVFQPDAFFIALYDEEASELDFRLRVDEGIQEVPERRPLGTGLTSLVVSEKKSLLIRDFEKEKDHLPEAGLWGTMQAPASWLGVPMLIGQRLIGVICVQAYRPHTYGEEEQQLLSTVADQVAMAIDNARLFTEAEQRAKELSTMLEAARAVSSTLNLQEVLSLIAEEMVKATGAAGCTLSRWDREADAVVTLTEWRQRRTEMTDEPGTSYALEDFPITRTVLEKRQPINILATDSDADLAVAALLQKDRSASLLMLPLVVGEQVIGLVELDESEREREFTAAEIRLCQALADQVAMAIQNARLYEAEQRRRRDAEALRETALALTSALDRNRVVERILTQLQEVVPYDSASVQLLRKDELVLIGGRGFPNLEELLGVSFPVDADNPNREVMYTLSPFIVNDAPLLYEAFTRQPFAAMGIRSWLGVPMLIGERTVGMITLDKCQPGFYTQEHARLAQAFAAQAAIAIENARLFEEVEKRRVYLEGVLREAPDAIITLDDRFQVVEWNAGAERLFGYSQEEAVGQHLDDLVTDPDVFEEATAFTQRVLGRKALSPTETIRYRKDGSPVAVIVAGSPILVGDELIGVVAVYTDITARVRMEETLRALALIDDLTGLYNRRGFFTLGQQQLKAADRAKSGMALLFADFNGLKRINDALGHPEGDRALIETADVLRETFRESDIIARFGGDEFVVLAIETDGVGFQVLTTRLQENLEAHNARKGRRYKLSLSVGLARYDPESPCSIEELLAQADRAMYERKRGDQRSSRKR